MRQVIADRLLAQRVVDWHEQTSKDLEIRSSATRLLMRSEQYALQGQHELAVTLFAEVWMMTKDRAADLANSAAWGAACVSLRLNRYQMAAEWLDRVSAPVHLGQLWQLAQHDLVSSGPPAITSPSNHHLNPEVTLEPRAPSATVPLDAGLPPLRVACLGSFQVARGGVVLDRLRARKALAVLRYLLTCPHYAASKDELMETLWPEVHPDKASHSLHVAVSTLRTYLNLPSGNYVIHESGDYLINPAIAIEDDHRSFLEQYELGNRHWRNGDVAQAKPTYMAAVTIYRGDYYVESGDLLWATIKREQLLAHYLAALDRLGQIFLREEALAQAIDCYQRILSRDDYREDAHRHVMWCYWQLGRRGEAIRQYEHCCAVLARDLDLPPMPETQALFAQVCQGEPTRTEVPG